MLNYLYALLESEARLAASALGLDPGLGFLHVDARARDSLACDLMEPVRPQVDAFVLDWITRTPLKREWFFEQRDGTCRLMASFTARLSETVPIWARAVAPIAEWVARTLWLTTPESNRHTAPATRLTQSRKREAKGARMLAVELSLKPECICRKCGVQITQGQDYCGYCAVDKSKETLAEAARLGRVAAQSPEAQAKRAKAIGRHSKARQDWLASSLPTWLDNEAYLERIQPRLAGITYSAIASALGVSLPYAADIRAGRRLPHPRHWLTLAKLAGVSLDGSAEGERGIFGRAKAQAHPLRFADSLVYTQR